MSSLTDKHFTKNAILKHCLLGVFWIFMFLYAGNAKALPDFSAGFELQSISFYPDNEDQGVVYYMPGDLRLSQHENNPRFGYDLFRYIGRKMTGDAGKFRVRGVLSFEIEKPSIQDKLRVVKKQLKGKYRKVVFRPVPVNEFSSKLIYSIIESNDENTAEINGGVSKSISSDSIEGQWQKRKFTIGLQATTAQLFWDNFKNERLQLSLSYHWKAVGVIPVVDEEGKWEASYREVSGAIPINVSAKKYPELFKKNESWQKLTMAHTNLSIYCYDFINELKTDLYSVTVEVMFRTLRNQDYKDKVKFLENDDSYKQHISFRLAKDLDQGYKFRVKRLYQDGRLEISKWKQFNSQHLDATYYVN